jgi:hypothetical protein
VVETCRLGAWPLEAGPPRTGPLEAGPLEAGPLKTCSFETLLARIWLSGALTIYYVIAWNLFT